MIRSRTNAASSAKPATLAVNKPAGATVGDVLVITQWMTLKSTTSAANMTAPAGFTQQGTTQTITDGSFGMYGKVWKRTVDGTEGASFTFGFDTNADGDGLDCECWQTGTFDSANFFAGGPTWGGQASAVTAMVAPSVTPSVANTKLVCKVGAYVFNNVTSFTPPTGMTEDIDVEPTGNGINFTSASLALSTTAATGTKTFTNTRASYYASLSYAVAPQTTATASGSVTLGGTATAQAPASATTGSIALNGAATPQAPAAASGTVSLGGAGAASGPASASGGITLSGTGTGLPPGPGASGSITLGGTATPSRDITVTVSGQRTRWLDAEPTVRTVTGNPRARQLDADPGTRQLTANPRTRTLTVASVEA